MATRCVRVEVAARFLEGSFTKIRFFGGTMPWCFIFFYHSAKAIVRDPPTIWLSLWGICSKI